MIAHRSSGDGAVSIAEPSARAATLKADQAIVPVVSA
jgi:hypothetical protein